MTGFFKRRGCVAIILIIVPGGLGTGTCEPIDLPGNYLTIVGGQAFDFDRSAPAMRGIQFLTPFAGANAVVADKHQVEEAQGFEAAVHGHIHYFRIGRGQQFPRSFQPNRGALIAK